MNQGRPAVSCITTISSWASGEAARSSRPSVAVVLKERLTPESRNEHFNLNSFTVSETITSSFIFLVSLFVFFKYDSSTNPLPIHCLKIFAQHLVCENRECRTVSWTEVNILKVVKRMSSHGMWFTNNCMR